MTYQYTHHGPLTPITPVHSPHPSNASSFRSRTPGQLSLHEYRKQQVTPSPPALQGQRSVKKKQATSSLNKSERITLESESLGLYQSIHTLSTPPLTPALVTPYNFTSPQSLPNACETRFGPVAAEFVHLDFAPHPHQHQQKWSIESEDAPLLDRSGSSGSLGSPLSQFLLPSTPPLPEESESHYLSSFFPITHAAPRTAQDGYHALSSGEDLEGELRSTDRLVFHSNRPGFSKPSQNEGEHTSTTLPPGRTKNLRADLGDRKISVGGRAPWYVLNSARLPGIGRSERESEDELGSLRSDSEASLPAKFQLLEQQNLSGLQPRERHFKAAKRLPHPGSQLSNKKRPSPLNFSAYPGKPLAPPASIQTSSISTLSSSNFNFPQPPVATRFSARAKHVTFDSQENLPPTIIQHRGVSFELINPHDSLRQSDLRTPLEIEDSDFFSGPITPSIMPSSIEDSAKKDKQKAQLYPTIQQAVSGIRKTSAPEKPTDTQNDRLKSKEGLPSVNTDFVLGRDLTPEKRAQQIQVFQGQVQEASQPSTSSLLVAKAAAGIATVAGSIERHSFGDGSEDAILRPKSKRGASKLLKYLHPGRESGLDGAEEDGEYGVDDEFEDDNEEEEQQAEAGVTEDVLHSYAESDYAQSAYARSIVDTRRSIPFGLLIGETDYTEISLLDQHRFSAASQTSAGGQFVAEPSTLSEIIHGYEDNRNFAVQLLESQVEGQSESGVEFQAQTPINPQAFTEIFEPPPISPPHAQNSVATNPFDDEQFDTRSDFRDLNELLKREITGLSDESLDKLSPGGESTTGLDEFTSSTISRSLQAPKAPPSYGLPPLPSKVHRLFGLFANRDITPSSSEAASQLHSYGDTRQLLKSSSTVEAQNSPTDCRPTRIGHPPVTEQISPIPQEWPEDLMDGYQFTIATPAKRLRCMNPDPLSADSKGSIQSEGAYLLSDDTVSDHSGHHMSPFTRSRGKDTDETTGRSIEDFRNPFSDLDSSYHSTTDRRHGVPREHPFLDPHAVDGPIASRASDVVNAVSSDGSIADISDGSNLSDMEQTEEEIAAMMDDDGQDDWAPKNRDSGADDWTTVRDPSQASLPRSAVPSSSSMAEYNHTPPGRLYQNEAFRSGATISSSPTFSLPLSRAHLFGHSGHVHDGPSPSGSHAWVEQNVNHEHSTQYGSHQVQVEQNHQNSGYYGHQPQPRAGLPGDHGPFDADGLYENHSVFVTPATFMSNQVQAQLQAARNYIMIPDNMLSTEPDDSPAHVDGPFDYSSMQRSPLSSPPTYASQEAGPAQPMRPEPAYYSPTRNRQPRSRPTMDSDAQHELELQAISGQRTYRQHNGSQIARASVVSQRSLQPLALQATLQSSPQVDKPQHPVNGSSQSLATDNTHWSWFQLIANRISANNSKAPKDFAKVRRRDGTILPRFNEPTTAAELRRASTMSELQQSRLPGYSITADRCRTISERHAALNCLLLVGWFPPFALLLGHDLLNPLVSAVSNGDVNNLPQRWKTIATRIGWAQMTAYIILLVVLLCYHESLLF